MKKPTYIFSLASLSLIMMFSLGFLNKKPYAENELMQKIKHHLNLYNHYLPQEKIYLHFDKPFYKPGDDIWFSAYLRNGNDHKPSEISEILNVELINPKGNVEKALRLIGKEGSFKGDFKIEGSMPGGMYKVRAYTNWMKNSGEEHYFMKEIQVQAVTLPRLLMKLDFERKAYGPGDEVIANLTLSSLQNKPLSNHQFTFNAQIEGKELTKGSGKTDQSGKAIARFKLPEKLKSNDGLLNVMIAYEGMQESISRAIPIVLNNIDLQFFPEGGDWIAGVESKIAFKALNEFGKPADIEGAIYDENNKLVADFKSFHMGMGAFKLKSSEKGKYFAKITQPEGIERKYPLPSTISSGYRLSVSPQRNNKLSAKIHAPFSTSVSLIAQMRGSIYFSREVNVTEGENEITIPLDDFPAGVAQITVFDKKAFPRCERLVFVNSHKQLQVEISTDKDKYLPREQVNLTIHVKDENGLPAPGHFSLSVVDDKLISFADDKQAHILSSMLLTSDLKGKVEEPNFYFDQSEPKAAKALDYLLMTQGWRRFKWEEILSSTEVSLQNKVRFAPERAVLRGKVIKFKDDQPIINARVVVLETEEVAYTNAEGKFEFKNLDLSVPRTLQVIDDTGKETIIQVNDYAQEYLIGRTISGRVVDKTGKKGLPGVSVLVKGTNTGTITDINGNYTLPIPEGGKSLAFSYIGFITEEAPLRGQGTMNIEMTEDIRALQEMVVVRFGAENRRERKLAAAPVPAQAFKVAHVEETFEVANEEEIVIEIDAVANLKLKRDQVQGDFEADMIVFEEAVQQEAGQEIYAIVENMPEYPGGMEKLHQYLSKNITYPGNAKARGIEGKVYVQFTVMEDGSIADVFAIKGIGAGCDEEAQRVVSSLPKWNPGKQRGQPVKTRMVLPITFNLNDPNYYQSGLMIQVASNAGYGIKATNSQYYKAREFYSPVYNPQEKIDTRTDFRKTIYWNPDIKVDKSGIAKVSFYNSDEVTAFRAIVEGIADEGLIGRKEHTYFTQLPFSLDTKIPEVLAYDDKVAIPVMLKNNTGARVKGRLTVEVPENLKLTEAFDPEITLAANQAKALYINYEVLPNSPGEGKVQISFQSDGLSDSFEQPIEIRAKGFPASISFSGNEAAKTFNLNINDLVKNSLTARLTAYPDVLSDLMSGIESILREPYGCFEQTSSSTYPNIIALQYMETSGNVDPKVRERAISLIEKGYKKLISFETKEKGYEWFGSTPPHEGLTAYGLLEFKDMEKVYTSVDSKMMQRTANWIMERRDGKGGFSRSPHALDAFGSASPAVTNAYIVYALTEAGYKDIEEELGHAYKTAVASGDAYQQALMSNAMFNFGRKKEGEALLKKITDMAEKNGIEGIKADHSITRSYGKSFSVETASLAVMAALKSDNKNVNFLNNAVKYIVQSRSNYGGFGSTQATILALKALVDYANYSKRTASSGTVELLVNGKPVASKFYEKGTTGEIAIEGLEEYIDERSKSISVQFKGTKDPLPYSVDVSWSTYTPNSNPECKVALQTSLNQKNSKVGETVRLNATLKNVTKEGLPMTVALIGIPSGLSVQPWQLKSLLEQKKVDFYEINKNYLVLYYRQMAPGAEHVIGLDLKAEIPGTYQAPASSAYLYYTNEYKSWSGGEKVVIANP